MLISDKVTKFEGLTAFEHIQKMQFYMDNNTHKNIDLKKLPILQYEITEVFNSNNETQYYVVDYANKQIYRGQNPNAHLFLRMSEDAFKGMIEQDITIPELFVRGYCEMWGEIEYALHNIDMARVCGFMLPS